jgi:hypothetical protein
MIGGTKTPLISTISHNWCYNNKNLDQQNTESRS